MEITLPISSIIIIAIGSVGVTIAIFTSIFFLAQKRIQHISNIFLSVLLLLSGLTLLNEVLTISGITNRFKHLYFIPILYSLSIGPLFYLFVKSKYYQKLSKIDYVHLIIPLVQAIIYWSIGFRSIAYKSSLWENPLFRQFLTLESFLFPLSLLGYSILSIFLLKKPSTQNYFWNDDLRNWLRNFANIFILISFLELFVSGIENFFGHQLGASIYILRFSIFFLFILWVAYNTIKLSYPLSIYNSRPKKNISLLPVEELSELKKELKRLMELDKIYLNSDLSLQILASYLGTTEKKCSHALRKGLEMNFNQYINSYRVDAFVEKVQEGKHKELTLLSLAYECGFDSKSTFNRAFKLLKGQTPSQFIKSL